MTLQQDFSAKCAWFGWAFRKLRLGVDEVGVRELMHGAARVLGMRFRRAGRAEIQLRSGPVLEFDYPSQFPTVLVMFGDFVDPEFAFLRRIARPDWVVADVGAAIGQFSLFAAGLPCAMVHAYEPSRANIATLQRNVSRNGAEDRIKIHQLAFANKDGEAMFVTTASTWMSHLDSGDSPDAEKIVVRTFSGELERENIDHLAVLKINVAGTEAGVIEGAMPFLAAGKADILLLLLGLASLPWYAKLAEQRYRFFYYHPFKQKLWEVTAFDRASVLDHRPWPSRNIIAIHQDAIKRGVIGSIPVEKL